MNARATTRYRSLTVAVVAACLICGVFPAAAGAANGLFSNTTQIFTPDLDNAEPSNIAVSGMPGVVTDVNVFLNLVVHTNPDDFEVLLVAPSGQSTVLMNDVGGTVTIEDINLSLNDQAAGPIPNGGPIMSQSYQPSDSSAMPGLEPFISPAPLPPYGLTLSVSNGTNPNGTWTLYVDDDVFNLHQGNIAGGWSLSVTTTDPPPPTPTTPTTTPTTTAPTATPTTTAPTGQRAAAIKKCKKKYPKGPKRKKCIKKAKKLPV